jgi:cell pole-organizing protein PopZ
VAQPQVPAEPSQPAPSAEEAEEFAEHASFTSEPGQVFDIDESADFDETAEEMAAQPLVDAGYRTIDEPDAYEQPFSPQPAPALQAALRQQAAPSAMEPPERRAPQPEHPLMSATTTAAVDSAFNTLAQTVLVQNGRTLEDLVREMLRPMLKSWLDDNLPGLVERLVRAEIERVSRGRT